MSGGCQRRQQNVLSLFLFSLCVFPLRVRRFFSKKGQRRRLPLSHLGFWRQKRAEWGEKRGFWCRRGEKERPKKRQRKSDSKVSGQEKKKNEGRRGNLSTSAFFFSGISFTRVFHYSFFIPVSSVAAVRGLQCCSALIFFEKRSTYRKVVCEQERQRRGREGEVFWLQPLFSLVPLACCSLFFAPYPSPSLSLSPFSVPSSVLGRRRGRGSDVPGRREARDGDGSPSGRGGALGRD